MRGFGDEPSEFPALLLHELFKINAGDIEMGAHIGNLRRVWFYLFFSNDRSTFDFCAGNYEWIGDWSSL